MDNILTAFQFAAVLWVVYSLSQEMAFKLKWGSWPFTCLKCFTFWVSLSITPFYFNGIDIIIIPSIAALMAYLVSTIKITL